jgi:RNA polymerase primary sigma factor
MRQFKISKNITNRETVSLDKYLQDVGREELITADEEIALAKKIKLGDSDALEKLIKANLRFAVSVAKQYQNRGLSLPDLINEGNLGLVKAAQRFDETRGFRFISYAVWWIRQSILQGLAEKSRLIRLPLNQVGNLNKVNKAISFLEQKFERLPSVEEIAHKLDMSEHSLEKTLCADKRIISFDSPINEDDDTIFIDMFISDNSEAPDAKLWLESLKIEIQRSLSTLTKREKEVVNLYYGLETGTGLTLEEIGEKFDLTRERVRQIKEKAIRRLKNTSRSRILRTYFSGKR